MLKIHIHDQAEQDIVDIWYYTFEKWGEVQADKYHDQLDQEFRLIAEFPAIGKTCDYIRKGYRKYLIGSHFVFYRTSKAKVHIIRVLNEKMDYERHL
ncbi:MAG: type II toxin-antitoxin system RelE/ParE family toxin [Robiginitomaculum sp.]|nr:type II toxin-antitoxin system RelE/ParE family toxin [Robiginitomaculum sp.]